MTKNWFLLSKEAMENFYLKKKKKTTKKKSSSCYLAGGGWKACKQFLEHDNYASCFSSREMAKQKLTKVSGEKKKKITCGLRTSLTNSSPKGEPENATGCRDTGWS